jgi:hypothetical protein
MSVLRGLEEVPGRVVANLVTCFEMPAGEVTPRTQATRSVGALFMLDHLVQGNWDPRSHEVMEEFLQRVLGNAARQGIVIAPVATESQVS